MFRSQDMNCTECGKALVAWMWDRGYSHCGGENEYAGPTPDGTFLCGQCGWERQKALKAMIQLDRMVNRV